MKRILPISAGLAMFIAALFLAGFSQQGVSAGPSQGLVLQTVLHASPTQVPTATSTPEPTVTPIAGWTKLQGNGVELWLPPGFLQASASQSPLRGQTLLYAQSSGSSGSVSVAVVLVKNVNVSPALLPFEVLDGRQAHLSSSPQSISLGRYTAYRVVAEGLSDSGAPVQRLLYWIDRGYDHWVIVFTAPANGIESSQFQFEQSARSFSVR